MSLKLIRIARLKQLQAELNVQGPVALGRAIGRKTNQTSDLLSGRVAFGEKVARSIEEFAALPLGWLDIPLEGRDGMADREFDAVPTSAAVSIQVPAFAPSEAGRAETQDAVVGRLLLSPRWLARSVDLVHDPKNLRFWHAADSAMEPTMGRGDLLLIDCGVTGCQSDGIYVLGLHQRAVIRRVRERLDGAYDVSSDSPHVKTVDVLAGPKLQVLGRVVWIWRGVPV